MSDDKQISFSTVNPLYNAKTLRDEFAMAAMQGLLASEKYNSWSEESIARAVYLQADAMLEERSKANEEYEGNKLPPLEIRV